MNGLDLVKVVTTKNKFRWTKKNHKMDYNVAAIDYGIKHNILRLLEENSCDVTVFPAQTTAKEIIDLHVFFVTFSSFENKFNNKIKLKYK